MNKPITSIVLLMAVALGGCASTDQSPVVKNKIPQWVLTPVVEDGLAAATCVPFSGSISVDQKVVIANARADLAKQISVKTEAMDKAYQRRTDSSDLVYQGGSFESIAREVASQNLIGSKATQFELVMFNGVEQFCGLVTISPEQTNQIIEGLISRSGVNVDPQSEKFLYEEFRAAKALEDLDEQLDKMKN